jgi:hypothetical protein
MMCGVEAPGWLAWTWLRYARLYVAAHFSRGKRRPPFFLVLASDSKIEPFLWKEGLITFDRRTETLRGLRCRI